MTTRISPVHEQVILGTILANRDVRKRLVKELQVDQFIAPQHRLIFAALQALEDNNLDYIPVTLKTYLPPVQDEWGGDEYLEKLHGMHAEENLEYHIQRAAWDAVRVDALQTSVPEIEAVMRDPRIDPEVAIVRCNALLERLRSIQGNKAYVSGPSVAARYNAHLHARENSQTIRSTGYPVLDAKLTNPLAPGQVTIIAAAPSIGKTSFAINLATRQSRHYKVGYLAWESGLIAANDIICSSSLGIPINKLIHPELLSRLERDRIDNLLDSLYLNPQANLAFMNRPPRTITKDMRNSWELNDRIIDWVDAAFSQWDRDIIYWDLFEKALPNRRPQDISWALDRIQEIAQAHKVHLVLLHQVTFKEAEKLEDKRPTRRLLKGSGGYIEVADTVFGLYREAVYKTNMRDETIEINCLKQRFGPWPWRVTMDWIGNCCRIEGGRETQITVMQEDEDEENI